MRKSAMALVVVSIAGAITLQSLLPMHWWHPYCDAPDDGPGYEAIGFPLPYAEPSGSSSLEYVVLAPLYLLDLGILAAPIFAILRLIWGHIAARRKSCSRLRCSQAEH
jgi:hypothetical protein